MSHRAAGRLTGALFLAAFVFYGGGSALADRPVGIGLMLLNSVAVAAIGGLAFRALREPAPRTARLYLAVRAAEAVLLALGVALLGSGAAAANDIAYATAMFVLGAGSVPFCLALGRHRWVPGWFAWWGAAGYALLGLGAVVEFALPGAGIALAAPGGLFEVAFGLFLLGRGFPAPAVHRAPGPLTSSA
ncbi:DUF4386 family protein [Actinorugispora endophytica]|uniref:Uncharacterized protein DUF4386 n=1 Tax=Actinorugispora endophytica TaxID=1605990 RepID=A0A4V3D7B3_9ACTN|nr:DUF4386 family protein [Actinorugispora endophytica]TDQ47207.1 uncharacterized protein DUF4386 [Actinorugispora endophytica]